MQLGDADIRRAMFPGQHGAGTVLGNMNCARRKNNISTFLFSSFSQQCHFKQPKSTSGTLLKNVKNALSACVCTFALIK